MDDAAEVERDSALSGMWIYILPVTNLFLSLLLYRWGIAVRAAYLQATGAITVWDWTPWPIKLLAWFNYPIAIWFSSWWSFYDSTPKGCGAFVIATTAFWAMIGYLKDKRGSTRSALPRWPRAILLLLLCASILPFVSTFVYQPAIPAAIGWMIATYRLCRSPRLQEK
jgi:hypothetical protein